MRISDGEDGISLGDTASLMVRLYSDCISELLSSTWLKLTSSSLRTPGEDEREHIIDVLLIRGMLVLSLISARFLLGSIGLEMDDAARLAVRIALSSFRPPKNRRTGEEKSKESHLIYVAKKTSSGKKSNVRFLPGFLKTRRAKAKSETANLLIYAALSDFCHIFTM